MFTSRAELRLSLRVDNADERLTPIGLAQGLVKSRREAAFMARSTAIAGLRDQLDRLSLTPQQAAGHGLQLNHDGLKRSAYQLLSYPDIGYDRLTQIWPELRSVEPAIASRVTADAVYSVYLDRQSAEIQSYQRDQSLRVPDDLDFDGISGLSSEINLKLASQRPADIAQAARIEGMTPAALTLLAAHARRRRPSRAAPVAV